MPGKKRRRRLRENLRRRLDTLSRQNQQILEAIQGGQPGAGMARQPAIPRDARQRRQADHHSQQRPAGWRPYGRVSPEEPAETFRERRRQIEPQISAWLLASRDGAERRGPRPEPTENRGVPPKPGKTGDTRPGLPPRRPLAPRQLMTPPRDPPLSPRSLFRPAEKAPPIHPPPKAVPPPAVSTPERPSSSGLPAVTPPPASSPHRKRSSSSSSSSSSSCSTCSSSSCSTCSSASSTSVTPQNSPHRKETTPSPSPSPPKTPQEVPAVEVPQAPAVRRKRKSRWTLFGEDSDEDVLSLDAHDEGL